MAYVPLERMINKTNGSIFTLVTLVSKRAVELADRPTSSAKTDSAVKTTTVAMQEVAAGTISLVEE